MRIRSMATVLLALEAVPGFAAGRGRPPPEPALRTVSGGATSVREFERVVDASMRKAGVAGLSVAIVDDRRIVYARAFGWRDQDEGTRLDETTVLAGASLSKPVFAHLVMLLVDDDLLDLDAPLVGYLPKPLEDYPGWDAVADDGRARTITARMVLSHTSGLPNLRPETEDEALRLMFQPGSRFAYSGLGYQLLQLVVETVTRCDLETLAHERVFAPLGMSRTSYVWHDAFASDAAAPHDEFGWAAEPDRPAAADAAGSLLTTARDYARFLASLLSADGRRRKLVARMFTPTVRITSPRMFEPDGGAPPPGDRATGLAWALGWGTFETPSGRAFFHTGHKGGAQNYAVLFPERGLGIVLLSNSDNFESVAPELVAAGIGDRASPFAWLGYPPFDPSRRRSPPPRAAGRRHG